jgi:hypothetical protein
MQFFSAPEHFCAYLAALPELFPQFQGDPPETDYGL